MTTTEAYAAIGQLLLELNRTKREDEEGYNFRVGLLRTIGLAIQEAYANGSGGGGGGASELIDLSDVSTAAATNRFVLTANGTSYVGRALTEADISDLGTYLTAEVNDLSAAVTWANVPDVNITETSVTQHEAALSITESQISDLDHTDATAIHLNGTAELSGLTNKNPGAANDVLMIEDSDASYVKKRVLIKNLPYAAASHTHAASDIISGQFADARISESSVTQHQTALNITATQFSGTLPLSKGGTNAITAAAARTNLGVAIGTNVQAYDADLQAISGLVSAANKGIYYTGAGTAALFDLSAAARSILDDASTAAIRTTLGVGTGDSPQFTAINVGNVSDTTVARAGAGDISVEGNLIYRALGVDVPITDGGTGASSASAARTNLGLAISTDVAPWRTISAVDSGDSPVAAAIAVHTYTCDATSGAITFNLPASADAIHYVFRVIKTDASGNAINVTPDGTETMNGSTGAVALSTQWRGFILTSLGAAGGWVLNQLA